MQVRPIEFLSDGSKLVGSLYLPDQLPAEPVPGVVACSGYLGLNTIYPRLFATALTRQGFAVLGFDYRSTGESEGEPGRILIEEETRDIQDGLGFLEAQEMVDEERLALVAWGMGCAAALPAALEDSRARAVACLNGFYHGRKFLEARHEAPALAALEARLEADKAARSAGERGEWVEPFTVYPLDPATAQEVKENLEPVEHFGPKTALELLESILAVDLEPRVAGLAPRPLFVGHGAANELHPIEPVFELFARAAVPKTMHVIDGKHNDFMQEENPRYQALMRVVGAWLRAALTAA